MNQKTARFLRHYGQVWQLGYRQLKRDWNSVPRNMRGGLRNTMQLATDRREDHEREG